MSKKTRCLWIDALSINQADNEEKAKQIGLLFNILERANAVIAWLGEETEYNRTAVIAFNLHMSPTVYSTKETMEYAWGLLCDFARGTGTNMSTQICKGFHDIIVRPWSVSNGFENVVEAGFLNLDV